jgi:murein DD-endopeptidase MepM/ murein hydrolase activator NlpD
MSNLEHLHRTLPLNPKLPLLAVILMGSVMAVIFSQISYVSAGTAEVKAVEQPEAPPKEAALKSEVDFSAPYDNFVITQGPHGFSYGHTAIDLSAGKGAAIKSPIPGRVTQSYVDGLGNPTLVIENDQYRVTLLHGKYNVSVGDAIELGQHIGYESNLGNTRDMQGRSCAGRDCGYHTHLNVFDKLEGTNVNPLPLIKP